MYFIFKAVFYIFGFIHARGVILGLIAAVLTISVGMFAFKEKNKPIAHWLAVLTPLIIVPLTPIIMIHNLGQEIFQIEKITILAVFECLAITQVILAILMFKNVFSKKQQ